MALPLSFKYFGIILLSFTGIMLTVYGILKGNGWNPDGVYTGTFLPFYRVSWIIIAIVIEIFTWNIISRKGYLWATIIFFVYLGTFYVLIQSFGV